MLNLNIRDRMANGLLTIKSMKVHTKTLDSRIKINHKKYLNKISFHRYIPGNEGKYIHIPNPYIHIDNPYDGGYGPYAHDYEPYVGEASVDQYKLIKYPGEDNPFYKDGYYKNNGIKIIKQNHNYKEDKYDFE